MKRSILYIISKTAVFFVASLIFVAMQATSFVHAYEISSPNDNIKTINVNSGELKPVNLGEVKLLNTNGNIISEFINSKSYKNIGYIPTMTQQTYATTTFPTSSYDMWIDFDHMLNSIVYPDKSFHQNDAWCNSTSTCPFVPGFSEPSGAALFDGIDDYLTVNITTSTLLKPTSTFSISMFIRPFETSTVWQTLYLNKYSHAIRLMPNGRIRAEVYNENTGSATYIYSKAGVIKYGYWNQVVFQYDGSTISLYINGELVKTESFTGQLGASDTDPIYIGKYKNNQAYFGMMDDIRVGRQLMNIDEIKNIYLGALGNNLMELRMNYVLNGNTYVDHSYYGNNAVCSGSYCPSYFISSLYSGAQFDGIDDYLSVPYSVSMKPTSTFSLFMWLNPSSASQSKVWQTLYINKYSHALRLMPDGRIRGEIYNNDLKKTIYVISKKNAISYDTLNQLVLTYDGNTLLLYVNGQLVDSTNSPGTLGTSDSSPILIGKINNQGFNGIIDEVRLNGYVTESSSIYSEYINRQPAIIKQGILYVQMRSEDTGFNKDRVLLAGSNAWVGKLRLQAYNESILLKDLKLTNTSIDSEDSIKSVCLYKSHSTAADQKIGCTGWFTGNVGNFQSINYTLSQGTHDLYIFVETNGMNNGPTGTADTKDLIEFQVITTTGHLIAEGLSSGISLTYGAADGSAPEQGEIVFDKDMDGTYNEVDDVGGTDSTSAFYIAGSKVGNVQLISSYGGYSVDTAIAGTGIYTLAILGITSEYNNNTDTNGNPLKLGINEFRFDLFKSDNLFFGGYATATIERIGGVDGAVPLIVGSGTTGYGTMDDWYLSNAKNYLSNDSNVDSGTTAYYVITGQVTQLDSNPNVIDRMRINLDDVKGTAGNDDVNNNIDWFDGYDTTYNQASDFDYLLLDVTSITGITIHE